MKVVLLGGYHWDVLHEGCRSQDYVVALGAG